MTRRDLTAWIVYALLGAACGIICWLAGWFTRDVTIRTRPSIPLDAPPGLTRPLRALR